MDAIRIWLLGSTCAGWTRDAGALGRGTRANDRIDPHQALNWRPGILVMVILLAVRQFHRHLLDGRLHLMSRRAIVGGDGERFMVTRRGRWQTVCTRGAWVCASGRSRNFTIRRQ